MKRKAGFTLLEMLVVVAILVILMGFVLSGMTIVRDRGRKLQARKDIDQIKVALHAYLSDYNELPDGIRNTGQDFVKVMRGENVGDANKKKYSYMDFHKNSTGMRDPWDNFYLFEDDAVNQSVRIWSVGPDATSGTDDDVITWRE